MKKSIAALLMITMLAGCSGMTRREQNTYVGAVIGSILWIPGAAIGGLIGHGMK